MSYKPTSRKKEEEIETNGHFDALAMVDLTLPSEIKKTARATCRACGLYPEASKKICRECPLPDFLQRLGNTIPEHKEKK